MPNPSVRLFLSCVSSEFGAYRDALRRALTRPNVEVKIQEDFKARGGDTLKMLAEYVEQCEAVVHFVGDMAGSTPAASSIDDLLRRSSELETRLAEKGLGRDALMSLTYTQWEAWLAIGFDRNLLIVEPAKGVARGPGYAPSDASREAQAHHLARLRAIDRYPLPPFRNEDNLVAQIFGTIVIDALVKAVKMASPRQPRNLPLASLGDLFKGREKALEELRAALNGGKGAAVVGRALHGLGGVGKTRLAIEYAWAREADYSALLFVRADSPAALNANLAALAGASVLDLPEKEAREDAAKIEAVLRWLGANPTWLMILDNVDDPGAVKAVTELMPRLKGGHVIVTARASNFPATVRKLEVDVLDEDAATQFLLERTADDRQRAKDDEAQAHTLAHELGGLALGLEQAGAHIATDRIGFARYLKLWSESREKALAWADATVTGSDRTLATTWATSVARLSPESRRLLDRLAMLAPNPIPYSLLDTPVPGEVADYDTQKAAAGLFAYSLVTRAKGEHSQSFVIHRLVQDFGRRAMTEERRGEALREALGWVDGAFEGDPWDVRSWPILDSLVPHALGVARLADQAGIVAPTAHLLSMLGLLLYGKARYTEAEALYRRALAINEARYGPVHPRVAIDLNNLALVLLDRELVGEAEPLFCRALTIFETSHGTDDPQLAAVLSNLGNLLYAANRLEEAEPLYRRALAIDEANHGPDHPEVGKRLSNLAVLLNATNRLDEAELLVRRALAIDEANLGPAHPGLAATLNTLAGVLRDRKHVGDAQQLVRRAFTICESSLGPDHPSTATARANLLTLNSELRLNDLAHFLTGEDGIERLSRLVRAVAEKSLARDHPDIVALREYLAALEVARGKGA
jgi:tetratricopeptide (TPR) repeat protein